MSAKAGMETGSCSACGGPVHTKQCECGDEKCPVRIEVEVAGGKPHSCARHLREEMTRLRERVDELESRERNR